MFGKWALPVVAALSLAIVVGCGGKEEGEGTGSLGDNGGTAAPAPASTPEAVLENMRLALVAGDGDAFVACFVATPAQETVLRGMARMVSTTLKFRKAMVAAYGEEALTGGGMQSDMSELTDENWLDEATVTVDGDKATVSMEDKPQPLSLVKQDGSWKIDAAAMMPPGKDEDLATFGKMSEAMVDAMEASMGNIGKPGYTAEKINEGLRQAMMEAMFGGAVPQP